MKKFMLFCVVFLLFFSLFAEDDEDKLKLAVMDLEDLSGKLSEDTLSGASEYFRVIFAQTNRYIIISKDRQKNQISDLRKKYNTDPSYKSCTDKNCQIQLGQALSADLIVKTSVSFFAGFYTLASELIDLEKEATIIAATEEYDGTPQALRTAIKNIVTKIVKVETDVNGEIAAQEKKPQKPVSNKDSIACEYARSESNDFAWKAYLEKYPKGGCADEAKDELDKSACKKAEKKNTVEGWKEYLREFPDGKCEFKAQTTLQKIKAKEEKEAEFREKAAEEQQNFDSKADDYMNRTFTGRYNFGIVTNFNLEDLFGFSTGFDFNFNVFRKPYGGGAGNLFVGFGVDFSFYLPIHDEDLYNMEMPILLNLGYDFKINNPVLRYVGLWFSPGVGISFSDYYEEAYLNGVTFAWELGFEMIFSNRFMLDLGFGGLAYADGHGNDDDGPSSHFFLNIGTIF